MTKERKQPIWTRAADILFRTAHVAAMGIFTGGTFFDIPHSRLMIWIVFIGITGLLLVASEINHDRQWIHQARGIMVIIHAGLFEMTRFFPGLAAPCLIAAIIVGMTGSHMTKKMRYYSFLYGSRQD